MLSPYSLVNVLEVRRCFRQTRKSLNTFAKTLTAGSDEAVCAAVAARGDQPVDAQAEPRQVQQLREREAGQGGRRGQLHSHGEAETSQGLNIYTTAHKTLFKFKYFILHCS